MIPLLAIQTGLVLSISRIYGYQITAARARELIVTFGVAMIARTLFQELSKLGGVPGWLLSSAIATSTTVAIGYAAMTWFARGDARRKMRSASKLRKSACICAAGWPTWAGGSPARAPCANA